MTGSPDDRLEGVGEEKGAGGGESQGGAYPNPHGGKGRKRSDGAMGHGGQSDIAYHGSGQLGEDDVEGPGNPNAPAKDG